MRQRVNSLALKKMKNFLDNLRVLVATIFFLETKPVKREKRKKNEKRAHIKVILFYVVYQRKINVI